MKNLIFLIFISIFIFLSCSNHKQTAKNQPQTDEITNDFINNQESENYQETDGIETKEKDFDFFETSDSIFIENKVDLEEEIFENDQTVEQSEEIKDDLTTNDADFDSTKPTTTVTKSGGTFFFLNKKIKIIFPKNWIKEEKSEISIKEKNSLFTLESSISHFAKQISFGIKTVASFGNANEKKAIGEKKGTKFLRLNSSLEKSNNYIFANIIKSGTFGIVPFSTLVCPSGMVNIESQKVWQFDKYVSVDTCMDKYEASKISGNLGNKNQSSSWTSDCEEGGTCGDSSTTATVTSVVDTVPLSDISWYQAVVLCQNSGKKLCKQIYWQVACEGSYEPTNPNSQPCRYGVAENCQNLDEEKCFLKSNYNTAKNTYETEKNSCQLEYEHCKDSPTVCSSNLTTCKNNAQTKYEKNFQTGHFKTCCSKTQVCDMVGNLSEFILYEDKNSTVNPGVTRGGNYLSSKNSSDMKCRTDNGGIGGEILPDSSFKTIGFRCCIN